MQEFEHRKAVSKIRVVSWRHLALHGRVKYAMQKLTLLALCALHAPFKTPFLSASDLALRLSDEAERGFHPGLSARH